MGMMETRTASNGRDYETIVEEEFRQGASKRGGGLKERDEGPEEEERKREVEEDGGCDLMSLCHVPYR